jgi:hypothetical protein
MNTWSAGEPDVELPNLGRVNDYLLGGVYNFGADRILAERLIAAVPDLPLIARAHRGFQLRAVRFCLNAGIRQFVDLGCGIPSVGHVPSITIPYAPDARTLCVDTDPVAVALAERVHADNTNVIAVQGDLRYPDQILNHPLLNLAEPAAVLMLSVLHLFAEEDDPGGIVASYRDRLAAGSHLIVSHPTTEARPADLTTIDQLTRDAGPPSTLRPRADIARLLTGLDLAAPGLVWVPQWRPDGPGDLDDQPHRSGVLAAVGANPHADTADPRAACRDIAELAAAGSSASSRADHR